MSAAHYEALHSCSCRFIR